MFSEVFSGPLAMDGVIHASSIGVAGSSLLGYSGGVPVLFLRSSLVRYHISIKKIGPGVDHAPTFIHDTSERLGSQQTVDRTKIGMISTPITFSFCLILWHYPVI